MDSDVSTLKRTGSSPYLLGTGSTGMLLITTKPMDDQTPTRSYDVSDRTSNAYSSAFSSLQRSRLSGGHIRDSDSGFSNGNSLSPSPRYQSTSMDRARSPTRHLEASLSESYNDLDTSQLQDISTNDLRPRSLSRLTPQDFTSTGRCNSLSRLNMSQDWSSPTGRSFSQGRSRTGASTIDLNRSTRLFNGVDKNDLNQALEDSEDRRQLLVDRLKDAQSTIKMQSERLSNVEDSVKDATMSLDDMHFKEKEYKKKINNLERERDSYHDKHMDGLKAREGLQYRIETLTTEVAALKTTTDLIKSDMKRKDDLIRQLNSTLADLEEENNKLIKCKETSSKEVTALRQSLELSKARTEYLENHGKDTLDELSRFKEDSIHMAQDKGKMCQKVAGLENRNFSLTEENKAVAHSVQSLTQDKHQLTKRVSSLEATVTDLKATLVSTSADKERFFQQKMELSSQIQNAQYDKENLEKVRNSLEEQLGELNAEVAQLRLQIDRGGDAKRQQDEEMGAVKKVGEVLSTELGCLKRKLEQSVEQNQSLEHTKKLAFQQHELYEKEIQSLETQLKQSKQMLTSMQDEIQKERSSSDHQSSSLKDEIKDLKTQRNQLELKGHETEAKLRQAEHNLKSHSDDTSREIDSWKDQCEKLTASNSRREMEIQTLNKTIMDQEEEISFLKDNNEMYREQYQELADAEDESSRIKEENRRLLQERAENQQVIQLLEMQKNILAKTTEGSMSKVHDAQQLQYQIEQLTIDKHHLEGKISILEQKEKDRENSRDDPVQETSADSADVPLSTRERLCELETQNHHLRALNNRITEQLTRVEQENVSVQAKFRDSVPKTDFKSMEREKQLVEESMTHLKSEYSRLEDQYKRVASAEKSKSSEVQELWIVQKEKEALENQVSLMTTQVAVLDDQKKTADDKKVQLQKQLDTVHEKLFSVCQEDNSQVIRLQKQINNLTTELEIARGQHSKQEAMLNSFRDELEEEKTKKPSEITQSLDSVGEDLTALRRELQQLGEVIQSKDLEIEQLERQLRQAKDSLRNKEKQVEILTTGSGSGKQEPQDETDSSRLFDMRRQLESRIEELEDENEEISERITKIKKERDLAVSDADDLRDGLDDLQKICDNEHTKAIEKMKKDLSSKDRQIESLEEQLRRHTSFEIKKLKRGASKVDLLKAENRRLQSQITPATSHLPRFTPPDETETCTTAAEQSSVGSRLHERLQGGSSPSQRLLDRLYGNTESNDGDVPVKVAVQSDGIEIEKSSSSWDESSEDDANLSNNYSDNLNIDSVVRTSLESKPYANNSDSRSNTNGRRSWNTKEHNVNSSSQSTLRSLHNIGNASGRRYEHKGEIDSYSGVDSTPFVRSSISSDIVDQLSHDVPQNFEESVHSNKDVDNQSGVLSKPRSILKFSSRYDFLDSSAPDSLSYKRTAFSSGRPAKVDFVEPVSGSETPSSCTSSPSSDISENQTCFLNEKSNTNKDISKVPPKRLFHGAQPLRPLPSSDSPSVSVKTDILSGVRSPSVGSVPSRVNQGCSLSSQRPSGFNRLGRFSSLENLSSPKINISFPWRSKASET